MRRIYCTFCNECMLYGRHIKKIYSAMITLFNAAKIIIVHNADRNVLGEILVIK